MCGSLLPRVWHLDAVCEPGLVPGAWARCAQEQSPHRGENHKPRDLEELYKDLQLNPFRLHISSDWIHSSAPFSSISCQWPFSQTLPATHYQLFIDRMYTPWFQVPVGHPAEVDEIFDAISYSKGASVIRMLHDWIGDAVSIHFTFMYRHDTCPISLS